MSDSDEFIFNNGYCERTKRFRNETNMSAEEMAKLLSIPADRYRKYESRSPMPLYLVPTFCRIVGCDLEHLILGKPRERTKPVLLARKVSDDFDIEERVDALSQRGQQVARAVSETASGRQGNPRSRGIRGK